MSLLTFKALLPANSGPHETIVTSFDGPDLNSALYAFVAIDNINGGDLMVAVGRTLGIKQGVVQLGPLSVVSMGALGRIVLREGEPHVTYDGDPTPDPDSTDPSISVGTLVSLHDLLPSTTWLTLPFAFAGDSVVYDSRTGAPLLAHIPTA
jgi:hypothetical protein